MGKLLSIIFLLFITAIGLLFNLLPITVSQNTAIFYHFIGFFIIAGCAGVILFKFFDRKNLNKYLFFILFIGGVITLIAEKAQGFVPVRSVEVTDWFANLMGLTFAVFIIYITNLIITRKEIQERNEE